MTDYLDSWSADWEARRGPDDPGLAQRAWSLREQGWAITEIAGQLDIPTAHAWQLVNARSEYEKTPDPVVTIAHLLTTVNFNLAHVVRHLDAALASSGAERQFNLEHARKHAEDSIEHGRHLAAAVAQAYPAIGKEYTAVFKESTGPGAS
jgi:hypothetical protein